MASDWSPCSMRAVYAGLGTEEVEADTAKALQPPESSAEKQVCRWQAAESTEGGLELVHQFAVGHVTWHSKGDYFASVAPTGNTLVRRL